MSARRPASPPTTWIGETWRIAVAGVVGALFWFAQFALEPTPDTLLPLVDLVLGLGVVGALHWRRRWPIAIGVTAVLATMFSAMAVPATLIVVASLVTSRGWRVAAAVAGLGAATSMASAAVVPAAPADEVQWRTLLIAGGVLYGIAFGVGLYIRARRELAESRRERQETAEREHASRLAEAQANERARIAREMHDVLAHRISLVAMRAGAMTYRSDLTRDQLLDSGRRHRGDAGRHAGRPGVPARPGRAPRVPDHPGGVDQRPQTCAGGPGDDPAVRRSRRAARRRGGQPGAGVGRNRPTGASLPGAGVGLIGLQERVELAGGELTYQEAPDGTFRVRAWSPWSR